MNTVNQRIEQIIKEFGITPNSFATDLAKKPTVIYNILKGRNKPGYDLLVSIVLRYQINTEWLLLGTGEMFKNSTEIVSNKLPATVQPNNDRGDNARMIDVLAYLEAWVKIRLAAAQGNLSLDESGLLAVMNHAVMKVDTAQISVEATIQVPGHFTYHVI